MFFDIGANIGRWSFSNLSKGAKIIAVEASPMVFERLKANVSRVGDAIIPLNYAVCNNDGKDITFYQAQWDVISTIHKEWLTSEDSRFHNQPFTEITCKTITIDRLIELYGVPDLIKIDVEGGEYECITSLTRKVDTLCFEWASEVNDITFRCLDYLASLGFSRFYLQFADEYTFRPNESDYYDIDTMKLKLRNTRPKHDWGMAWCK
jgi:FkbM family methyltransferase